MSDPDRGAYTPPTDPPLTFDRQPQERASGPSPVVLIISLLVLVAVLGVIFLFYRSGLSQGAKAPVPVGQPLGTLTGAAPAQPETSDPSQGLQIYQQAEGQPPPTAPNFVQPPEQPKTRDQVATPPVAAAQPAPAASPVAGAPATVSGPPPAPVTVLPVTPAPKPAPVAQKPAPAPAPEAQKPKPVAAKPVAIVEPKAAPAKVAVAKSAPTPAKTGGAVSVQIGAFSSTALASKGWSDAVRIAPGAAAGMGKSVEPVERDGATLYRTSVTGFASRAEATAFCAQLKAAGKSCFVK